MGAKEATIVFSADGMELLGEMLETANEAIAWDSMQLWRRKDGTIGGYFSGVYRNGGLVGEHVLIIDKGNKDAK